MPTELPTAQGADRDDVDSGFATMVILGALVTLILVRLGIACGASRFALGVGAILGILVVIGLASSREESRPHTKN